MKISLFFLIIVFCFNIGSIVLYAGTADDIIESDITETQIKFDDAAFAEQTKGCFESVILTKTENCLATLKFSMNHTKYDDQKEYIISHPLLSGAAWNTLDLNDNETATKYATKAGLLFKANKLDKSEKSYTTILKEEAELAALSLIKNAVFLFYNKIKSSSETAPENEFVEYSVKELKTSAIIQKLEACKGINKDTDLLVDAEISRINTLASQITLKHSKSVAHRE